MKDVLAPIRLTLRPPPPHKQTNLILSNKTNFST